MKLSELAIGKTATIQSVGGKGALRQHFLDMGKEVSIMIERPKSLFLIRKFLHLHLLETKTVARQHYLTS